MGAQTCSEAGCDQAAAYRTRTKPAWFDVHITARLRIAGLEPLEPFQSPTHWRLSRCLTCGVETHSRFETVLQYGHDACRACYWRRWSSELYWRDALTLEDAQARADQAGYDYLMPLTNPIYRSDPHLVRCRACKRQTAERVGDMGFGCSCRRNQNPGRTTGSARRVLFRDSGSPVIDWWDTAVNASRLWATTLRGGRKDVAWRCPSCGHQFLAPTYLMVDRPECPRCVEEASAVRRRVREERSRTLVSDVPELMKAWGDERDPTTVYVEEPLGRTYRLRCPEGHRSTTVLSTFLDNGCSRCQANETRRQNRESGRPRLSPESITLWHPTQNAGLDIARVTSTRLVWWMDPVCGHEWQESSAERENPPRWRCSTCRSIMDSLAWHEPEVAVEWSPRNPLTPWQVRPNGQTTFQPEWVCASDERHVWTASVSSRSSGSGCPDCRVAGKSSVELDHHQAAVDAFGGARSGARVEANGRTWAADILVDLADGRQLVLEYDGACWHRDKIELDSRKTTDLLGAGYLVARLREHPLARLPVRHPHYREFEVYSGAPNPAAALSNVRAWVNTIGPTEG